MDLKFTVVIYVWKSEKSRNIPYIEKFDFLEKLYRIHVGNPYVLKVAD